MKTKKNKRKRNSRKRSIASSGSNICCMDAELHNDFRVVLSDKNLANKHIKKKIFKKREKRPVLQRSINNIPGYLSDIA